MADASHSMDKPAPQSASQWTPPFTHTSALPSARTHFHQPQSYFRASIIIEETDLSDTVYSAWEISTQNMNLRILISGLATFVPGGGLILFFSEAAQKAGGSNCTDNTIQCSHRFHKDTQVHLHILRRLFSWMFSSTTISYRAQLGRLGGSRSGLGSSNKIPCQALSLSL